MMQKCTCGRPAATTGPAAAAKKCPFCFDVNSVALQQIQKLNAQERQILEKVPDLLAAAEAAYMWLGLFSIHAPITFGGEAELSEQLRAVISTMRGLYEQYPEIQPGPANHDRPTLGK